MDRQRLLLVSNRLPVTATQSGDDVTLVDSSGGLAGGLSVAHESGHSLWLGWLGEIPRLKGGRPPNLGEGLATRRLVPVYLSTREVRQYYEGFSNGVIWPLFHYLLEQVPLHTNTWSAYREANERFADAVCHHHIPGDLIWVHDYHLMLLPALLRERLPEARIGFFLHIPFPSSEIFRILPWREPLLEGLLGADLVGFHTHAYVRHFAYALRQILGLDVNGDRVRHGRRVVSLGAFPMGPDAELFDRFGRDEAVEAEVASIRSLAAGRSILLAIDRLDYTKGIPRRLLAFGQLLERHPDLRDRVRLVQVAVPSRTGVEPYQAFRKRVEEMVGRINGQFGRLDSVPIHYLYRSFGRRELVAMYRSADVMLVTPIRDGMNLVAKEFVASRTDEDGVLVLSEFAGAASELGEAVLVNPYDVDGTSEAMYRAITMEAVERRTRMLELRRRVRRQDVRRWADEFIRQLTAGMEAGLADAWTAQHDLDALAARLATAPRLLVLVDYDGTLVPFASLPELAKPDAEVPRLLGALAAAPGRRVEVVSGRPWETLDRWFADCPIGLWAEHGLWRRSSPAARWETTMAPPVEWMGEVRLLLQGMVEATPGSSIEEKSASLAWHYRSVDPELGAAQAARLRRLLAGALRSMPADVLSGSKVIEVRPHGVSKRHAASLAAESIGPDCAVVAIGDDATDEEMFTALPATAVAIRVGAGRSAARYRLRDWRAVRLFLGALAGEGRPAGAVGPAGRTGRLPGTRPSGEPPGGGAGGQR